MPAKPESRFIERIHRRLPPVKEFYREKMSNPYRSGTPDVWYSAQRDLWIEYKHVVLPKRDGSYIHFDVAPLQRRWIESRRLEGRDVWLVVGCPVGGLIFIGDFPDGMLKLLFMKQMQTVEMLSKIILSFCNGGQKCQQQTEVRTQP